MNEELTAEEFAEFLKNMRASINLGQNQFADELGVRKGSYSNWETGQRMPRNYERLIQSVRVLVKSRIRKGA